LGFGGLVALIVVAVHGLFDVVFYVTRPLPLLGFALGCAFLLRASTPGQQAEKGVRKTMDDKTRLGLALAVFILMGASLYWRHWLLSAFYANLGTAAQTRVELSRYNPDKFDDPGIDAIRQGADLTFAENAYLRALRLNPQNLTALQRLTQITLSRGEYSQPLVWMQTAWSAGRRDEVTRLLYSDSLVANGQVEKAVQLVRGLRWAEGRLWGQGWYRYWLNSDYQRALYAWEAVLMLNPENQMAAYWREEARRLLASP